MNKKTAIKIVEEAEKDTRIIATLNTSKVRASRSGGYRVNLHQKRLQINLTARTLDDWKLFKELWSEL